LSECLGVDPDDLGDIFEMINLLPRFPGVKPDGSKGDLFPAHLAKISASRLLPELRGRRVVLAGRSVAKAFDLRMDFLEERGGALGAESVLLLPHPSGVNLWWNSPENRKRAREVLRMCSGIGSSQEKKRKKKEERKKQTLP
jgi:hypothetical protein